MAVVRHSSRLAKDGHLACRSSEISEIEDITLLQEMFQSAKDMQERATLRAAIQVLREREMNELPQQSDFSRKSLPRSRRMRKNQKNDEPVATKQFCSAATTIISYQPGSGSFKSCKEASNETDPVFENDLEKPQTFVRNSSTRRNRRSRTNTSSRSSDHGTDMTGIHTQSQSGISEYSAGKHSELWIASEETVSSVSPALSRPNLSENRKDHLTSEVAKERHDPRPRAPDTRDLTSDKNSPGISPYRSPASYRGRHTNDEAPKRTSVSVIQGATYQYKTITTSFRGPAWKPVSASESTSSFAGQNLSANNNKTYSQSEWPQRELIKVGTRNDRQSPAQTVYSSGNNHHPKHSARVVLKALGKKLFSAKGKTPTASGQQISSQDSSAASGGFSNATRSPLETPGTPVSNQFDTPKSRKTLQPSPFQQRKTVFEKTATEKPSSKVSYSWNRRRAPRNMTDVAPLSHHQASEAGNYFPGNTGSSPHKLKERNEGETDHGDSAVGELEDLLKQYTDPEKRVKIRETIRLLKQSLQEGDSSPSENQATENSPHQGDKRQAVEFVVDLQKTPVSPVSRFPGRSTSLRNPRPSYQPSAQAVNRANSFKLSRPKDFIIQKVGNSPPLTKVPETPHQDFKVYADNLNNNLPQHKPPESTSNSSGFTHNKTASPFSISPQGTYKKQIWTPPKTSTVRQKPAFSSSPPVSATLRSSAASSSLRRSESTKENRSSDFRPIAAVHCNVRRSKSILGRILGHKIDAEKSPFKPFQASAQEHKSPIHPALKTESQTPNLSQKPSFQPTPKIELPTPAPRAVPRNRTPNSTEVNSVPKQAPSPLTRTSQVASSKEAPTETGLPTSVNVRSAITSSSSSCSSTSSSSGDHVYEVAGSESDISSSGSSKPAESATLSRATRDQNDNETLSAPQTSAVVLSTDRDQNEEFESDKVLEDRLKAPGTEVENNVKHEGENQGFKSEQTVEDLPPKSSKSRTVLQPLKSHKVCEPETAQVFNIQVIRPIGVRNVDSNSAPTSKNSVDTNKSASEDNKETRKSSSSLSSFSSAANSEDEVLSDDEGSSSDERDMDRYSSRALQSRVSVKSQVNEKEDKANANVKTATSNAAPRRLRDRQNKPLNTGEDIKTRMQRFKGQVNGEADGTSVSKRNGSAKVSVSTGKRLDLSKYEKDGSENKKIASTAAKSTAAPKSTHRSTAREEKSKNGVDYESRKETPNGSPSFSADGDQKNRKVSSSSSADDSSGRVRRARRGKLSTETENGSDKLEKASSVSTKEQQDLGKGADHTSDEIVIGTKKSRERSAKVAAGDVNNNTKPEGDDIAPTNENVEAVVEDSLSSWSARRRKRKEKLESSATASSSRQADESSDSAMLSKEEEKEIIKQTKDELHVTHSSPALSEIGSLGGYTLKVSSNGGKNIPAHNEEDEEETDEKDSENKEEEQEETDPESSRVRGRFSRSSVNKEEEQEETDPESSRVRGRISRSSVNKEEEQEETNPESSRFRGRYSRSSVNKEEEQEETDRDSSGVEGRFSRPSDTRSSVSSKDDDTDKCPSPHDQRSSPSGSDVGDTKVVMELESEEDDVDADETEESQSESSERGESQNEREWEETRELEEHEENTDDARERDDARDVEEQEENEEEDEESVDIDANVAYEEKIETPEVVDDKEILENNTHSEEEPVQIQTNGDDTQQESVYKGEPANEIVPLEELTLGEEDVHGEVETPEERPQRRNREERKESATDEPDSAKPTRRTRRKDAAKAEVPAEELPKRRHNRNKHSTQEVDEEKTKKEERKELPEKVEEKKKSRRHNKEKEEPIRQTEKTKEELPTEVDTTKPEETPKAEAEESPKAMLISIDNVEEISDLSVLEKMLEGAKEYDDRRKIRSVIRALKRGEKPKVVKDPKYDTKTNGSINALNLQATKKNEQTAGDVAKKGALPREGARGSRFTSSRTTVTKVEKADNGSRFSSVKTERTTRMTSGQKKIGSVFDRGGDDDDKPKSRGSGSSRLVDLERRQAERKRELQRNRSMPASSSKDARKAFVAKLEASAPKSQGKKIGRSPTSVVPNANNVKQLLLKWCQSKTRGYEHVDVMNFSSSWASGMAFCALVHNFFPDAFDYSKLDPKNKAENLDLAFTKAEELADIAPLLEVEDMLIMGNRPDSKCIFTYVQFIYSHLKKFDRPLVPLKDGEKSETAQVKGKAESSGL